MILETLGSIAIVLLSFLLVHMTFSYLSFREFTKKQKKMNELRRKIYKNHRDDL